MRPIALIVPRVLAGFSIHDELALLVDAGLSSSDTVRAATSAPANYLSAADSLGTIAVGLYREISRTIADEIGAVLSAQADARLTERPTVDPQAYEAVLKGQFHYRRSTPEDFTIAVQYFESALAIDSLYAPAHVGIAEVWSRRAGSLIPSGVAGWRGREPSISGL